YLFVSNNICFVHQILVDGNTPHIIQLGLCNTSTVNFGLHYFNHHNTKLRFFKITRFSRLTAYCQLVLHLQSKLLYVLHTVFLALCCPLFRVFESHLWQNIPDLRLFLQQSYFLPAAEFCPALYFLGKLALRLTASCKG